MTRLRICWIRQAAEQAGSPEGLMAMLQGIDDALDDARHNLEDAKITTEAERQEASACLTVWVVNADGSALRRIYYGTGEAVEP